MQLYDDLKDCFGLGDLRMGGCRMTCLRFAGFMMCGSRMTGSRMSVSKMEETTFLTIFSVRPPYNSNLLDTNDLSSILSCNKGIYMNSAIV